jgi:hypothetical protein
MTAYGSLDPINKKCELDLSYNRAAVHMLKQAVASLETVFHEEIVS